MKIMLETIPHNLQRYSTAGDWRITPRTGNLEITVSHMGNEDYEFLVGLHEMIEVYLCKKRGITDEEVTAFDIAFELEREDGNTNEPGDHPAAPYRKEHFFATSIERLMAAELGVDWKQYDDAVNSL